MAKYARKTKCSFSDPIEGTKKHRFLGLCMRDCGVTRHEACAVLDIKGDALNATINSLRDMNGYEIRPVYTANPARKELRRYVYAYRCLGRLDWSGRYHDFTSGAIYQPSQDTKEINSVFI